MEIHHLAAQQFSPLPRGDFHQFQNVPYEQIRSVHLRRDLPTRLAAARAAMPRFMTRD